ncbi:MAG TPA: metallophosphoesterase [Acidothermaceae bacterium]|nr:metallophosphoesterase [Acidothermaceae bacterium]
MHRLTAVPLGAFALGSAAIAYASGIERRSPRLRRFEVPVLPAGSSPLRVLHFSDAHLTPGQTWKRDWIHSLAALEPDLVINTGDSIAHVGAVPVFLDALGPLLEKPGAFVFGSNDYAAPVFKNPARYLFPDDGARRKGVELPWRALREAMLDAGWLDLSNARGYVKADGRQVELVGVDDPHIGKDRYDVVAGNADPDVLVTLGVTHSPEPRVLARMAADDCGLILAGHTHGGQLRVPLYGALVTNCGLDRGRARGLSRYDGTWLHVSAGLGTSPFAPVRFACPPEATLLTLVAVH